MKLNHDCIRDLLIYLENNLELKSNGLHQPIKLSHILDSYELKQYSDEEIYYSASKLAEAKFLSVTNKNVSPRCLYITDISWHGHDYLNSIRDPKIWAKVKEKSNDLAGITFDIIKALAFEAAKNLLGLT